MQLSLFMNQVAGHMGELYRVVHDDNDQHHYAFPLLIKPVVDIERRFYEEVNSRGMLICSLMPRYAFSTSLVLPNPCRLTDLQTGRTSCIAIEDLTSNYHEPCIIDIKIGTRLYDDHATEEKKQRMIQQSLETTSGTLGLRICGLYIQESRTGTSMIHKKEYGRRLNEHTFKDGLYKLFQNNEGRYIRKQLLRSFIERLIRFRTILESENVRLYGTSLLFIFEGCSAWCADGNSTDFSDDSKASIYLIDFAHASIDEYGPDTGALFSIQNLIDYLLSLEHIVDVQK